MAEWPEHGLTFGALITPPLTSTNNHSISFIATAMSRRRYSGGFEMSAGMALDRKLMVQTVTPKVGWKYKMLRESSVNYFTVSSGPMIRGHYYIKFFW